MDFISLLKPSKVTISRDFLSDGLQRLSNRTGLLMPFSCNHLQTLPRWHSSSFDIKRIMYNNHDGIHLHLA